MCTVSACLEVDLYSSTNIQPICTYAAAAGEKSLKQ